jgi:hypothetical protein
MTVDDANCFGADLEYIDDLIENPSIDSNSVSATIGRENGFSARARYERILPPD